MGPRAPDRAQLSPCFDDWTVGLIPAFNCRAHASGAIISNIEKMINYYKLLEVADLDFQYVPQALLDKSA
jgi:hypothetical protein